MPFLLVAPAQKDTTCHPKLALGPAALGRAPLKPREEQAVSELQETSWRFPSTALASSEASREAGVPAHPTSVWQGLGLRAPLGLISALLSLSWGLLAPCHV